LLVTVSAVTTEDTTQNLKCNAEVRLVNLKHCKDLKKWRSY